MKSTPGRPAAIMVLTAFPPPPPTPTTLIRAPSTASTNSIIATPPHPPRSEELPQPPHHALPRPFQRSQRAVPSRARLSVLPETVQHETDGRRIHGTRDDVNQSVQM